MFRHLCRHCFTVCGYSMHSVYIGLAVGSNIWAYALDQAEVALQSVLQKKLSYIIVVRAQLVPE